MSDDDFNPWEVLGLPTDSSHDEVKQAARRLNKLYHPDRAGGDAKKQADVNRARSMLLDAEENKEAADEEEFEMSALALMVMAFRQALQEDMQASLSGGILSHMRNLLRMRMNAVQNAERVASNAVVKFTRLLKKLKRKGDGDNFLLGMLEQELQRARAGVLDAELELRRVKRSLELSEEYEETPDECDDMVADMLRARKPIPITWYSTGERK